MSEPATLQEFLKRKGAQAELARAVGCSQAHLCLVSNGERGLSINLAKKISDATGVPIQTLLPDLAQIIEAAE